MDIGSIFYSSSQVHHRLMAVEVAQAMLASAPAPFSVDGSGYQVNGCL